MRRMQYPLRRLRPLRLEPARRRLILLLAGPAAISCGGNVEVGPIGPTLSINPATVELDVGGSATIRVAALDEHGARTRTSVRWAVSDTALAALTTQSESTAVLVGRRPGSTSVRVVRTDLPSLVGTVPVIIRQ